MSYLTNLLFDCAPLGAMMNSGYEVAAMAVVPQNLLAGVGCDISRGVIVALTVPLSSHLWKERLERVTLASFSSLTAWTPPCAVQLESVHGIHSRLPSVGLAYRTLVTKPMGFLATAVSQLARIQSRLLIQPPIPKLQHFMLTFCQCGMAIVLAAPSDICAIWTPCATTGAFADGRLPLTATFTPPPSLFAAAVWEVVRAELISLTPLRN